MPVAEAPFRETKFGLVADVDGRFVLNARDSRWRDYSPQEVACDFEGKRLFKQLGFNISVLEPGRSLGLSGRRGVRRWPLAERLPDLPVMPERILDSPE